MFLIALEIKLNMCVNRGCVPVCVHVCWSVHKKVQIYCILLHAWIPLVCVSTHRADSSVRRSDSLSGKFTLQVAAVYTVG